MCRPLMLTKWATPVSLNNCQSARVMRDCAPVTKACTTPTMPAHALMPPLAVASLAASGRATAPPVPVLFAPAIAARHLALVAAAAATTAVLAHITGGLHPLAPQPQLPIPALRIPFHAVLRDAPSMPSAGQPASLGRRLSIPGQHHSLGQPNGHALCPCLLNLKTHAHPARCGLRHVDNHTLDANITSLPGSGHGRLLKSGCPPSRTTPSQHHGQGQHTPRMTACRLDPPPQHHGQRHRCTRDGNIRPGRKQCTLLQLQGTASHQTHHGIYAGDWSLGQSAAMYWHTGKHAACRLGMQSQSPSYAPLQQDERKTP